MRYVSDDGIRYSGKEATYKHRRSCTLLLMLQVLLQKPSGSDMVCVCVVGLFYTHRAYICTQA